MGFGVGGKKAAWDMKYEHVSLRVGGTREIEEERNGNLAELQGIMAGPRKHESGTESLGEILATLDDLNENVSETSGIVDYSQSLSDMFAGNEQFLREEIDTFRLSKEDEEALKIALDSKFEEISNENLQEREKTPVIGEGRNSEIEIKGESEARSVTLVQEKEIRGRETIGAAEAGASPVRDFPERYRAYVDRAGGSDIKLIFEKRLSKSDVDLSRGRLAMPHSKIVRKDFLTETKSVQEGEDMDVNLLDGQLKERSIRMGMWKTLGASYVLKKTWNDVVRENGLKNNDGVQIWSFRVAGELRLALVVLAKSVGNEGESSQIHE